jgi:hypothetical protein
MFCASLVAWTPLNKIQFYTKTIKVKFVFHPDGTLAKVKALTTEKSQRCQFELGIEDDNHARFRPNVEFTEHKEGVVLRFCFQVQRSSKKEEQELLASLLFGRWQSSALDGEEKGEEKRRKMDDKEQL